MKINSFRKSVFSVVITLSTASVYYAQTNDTISREKDIEAVVLTGVADIAKDRKTPVAVSTIKEAQIVERLGNQEFPEILATTPSIYATKGGGGFGDGRMNIRGFDTSNTAVMINGMPVNDMEGGTVYWSNWMGLSDVTSAMQVQRGLGSSKLAIASVGGTVNIITRAADKKQEGNVTVGVGNDGYHKAAFSYNTGKNANGWATSFLMSRTAGSMYVDGTNFEGYNYYLAVGYQPNQKHDLQLTFTGAPQWHHQNFADTIDNYLKYGKDGDPNRRYNSNWGWKTDEAGVRREYSTARNYYSKPVAMFNWDWKMSEKSKLSSVLYGSWGRGGGTGVLGSVNGKNIYALPKDANGQIRFDDIVTWNQGGVVSDFGAVRTNPNGYLVNRSNNGITMRAHVNSHDWYGILSNFTHKINESLNFSVGVDGRYYYGYHPGIVTDFLGANGYLERNNLNTNGGSSSGNQGTLITQAYAPTPSANPFATAIKDKSQITNRNYDGEVRWLGAFGQLEYSKDAFSAFVQGSVSNQGYQRIDNWIVDGVTVQQGQTVNRKTGFKNLTGFNVKGGANYNLNENHNVFANAGYYERQPFLYNVFPNNRQVVNPLLTNEKILGLEAGYGFRSSIFNANLNLYRTSWNDRNLRISGISVTKSDGTLINNAFANMGGVEQVHMGAEFEGELKPTNWLSINGMFSYGDWRYHGNPTGELFDDNFQPLTLQGNASNEVTLALDNVKVSDAAQTTAALGLTVEPVDGLKIFPSWRYAGRLYSTISIDRNYIIPTTGANAGQVPDAAKKGALELPSYNLFDLGASYTLKLNDRQRFIFTGNVYNLLDTYYISDGRSSRHVDSSTKNTWKGIDTRNNVYFGAGRTWAASVSFRF